MSSILDRVPIFTESNLFVLKADSNYEIFKS